MYIYACRLQTLTLDNSVDNGRISFFINHS